MANSKDASTSSVTQADQNENATYHDHNQNIQRYLHDGRHQIRLYQLIPADEEINAKNLQPIDTVINDILVEHKTLNISWAASRFQEVLPEFMELTRHQRLAQPEYNARITNLIETICKAYNIKYDPLFVHIYRYATNQWGPIYWSFIHLSSILLSYGVETGIIKDFCDFALVVHNIHLILPCSRCEGHYLRIKDSENIRAATLKMAYGLVVIGAYMFHKEISINVHRSNQRPDRPSEPLQPFTWADFARTYKCVTQTDETLLNTRAYIRSHVDFQPAIHNLVVTVLSIYFQQHYFRTSTVLKLMFNWNNMQTPENRRHDGIDVEPNVWRFINQDDYDFAHLSPLQVKWCLKQALLLQFQHTELDSEYMKTQKQMNTAIIGIYRMYPSVIRQLVEENLKEPGEMQSKIKILGMLEKLQESG